MKFLVAYLEITTWVGEMSTAFSSDGAEAISRQLQSSSALESAYTIKNRTESELRSYYEIERCRRFVRDNSYHQVD